MFKRLSLIVPLLLQFFCISAELQSAATQQSEQRKTSKPYTVDLSIFDSPGRDERLQINRVMYILGIAPGKTVADIGAGSGWFTVRCRETCAGYWNRVRHRYQSGGPHVTLNLEFAKRTCAASNRYWAGLITRCRQGQFLLKTYHEVAQPIVLLRNLRASLSPRAKVGVIDRNGNGENHGVAYQLLEQDDFVKDGMDYFLVFGAK